MEGIPEIIGCLQVIVPTAAGEKLIISLQEIDSI